MINTLKLSNLLFNNILIGYFYLFYDFTIFYYHSNLMSCAWDIITHIVLHKTKTNLENVSKKPSYAFVMNIKTYPNIAQPFIVLFMLSYYGK